MNGYETYQEMGRLSLAGELTKDYNLRLYPKERITPALRVAIKKNKSEIICRVLYDSMLEQAAEHYGLELEPEKMPPPSPAMSNAFREGDPRALLEALYDYVFVWAHWDEVKDALSNPYGGAILVEGKGAIVVSPESGSTAQPEHNETQSDTFVTRKSEI
jgi:hypothetical protein